MCFFSFFLQNLWDIVIAHTLYILNAVKFSEEFAFCGKIVHPFFQ